jgi:hypothetical protein
MLTDAVKVLVEAVSAFRCLASTLSGDESSYRIRESAWVEGHDTL